MYFCIELMFSQDREDGADVRDMLSGVAEYTITSSRIPTQKMSRCSLRMSFMKNWNIARALVGP